MIKAIYWTGKNTDYVLRIMFDDLEEDEVASEGTVRSLKENGADIGRWIIRNEDGSISSCKPEELHLYLGSCSEQGIKIFPDGHGVHVIDLDKIEKAKMPIRIEYMYCIDASISFYEVYEDRGFEDNFHNAKRHLKAEDVGRPDLHKKNKELLAYLAEVYSGIPIEQNPYIRS